MQSALLLPFRIVGRLDPYRMVGQPQIFWDQQQNAAGVGGYAGWEDVSWGGSPIILLIEPIDSVGPPLD